MYSPRSYPEHEGLQVDHPGATQAAAAPGSGANYIPLSESSPKYSIPNPARASTPPAYVIANEKEVALKQQPAYWVPATGGRDGGNEAPQVVEERRYCGMRPKIFWIVLVAVMVVIVAAAVGGGVGGALAGKSSNKR